MYKFIITLRFMHFFRTLTVIYTAIHAHIRRHKDKFVSHRQFCIGDNPRASLAFVKATGNLLCIHPYDFCYRLLISFVFFFILFWGFASTFFFVAFSSYEKSGKFKLLFIHIFRVCLSLSLSPRPFNRLPNTKVNVYVCEHFYGHNGIIFWWGQCNLWVIKIT